MARKKYVIFIPEDRFSAFDCGERIEMRVYYRWNLEIGDELTWTAGQKLRGIAEVVGCRPEESGLIPGTGPIYSFKKVSQNVLAESKQAR